MIALLSRLSLEDDFDFTRKFCTGTMACCYGPDNCKEDDDFDTKCNFQLAYETRTTNARSKDSILMQLTGKLIMNLIFLLNFNFNNFLF